MIRSRRSIAGKNLMALSIMVMALTAPAAAAEVSDAIAPGAILQDIAPLPVADLASYRGGETVIAGSQTLTAITKGNVLNGNFSAGAVTLSDNALSNFNGVGNFAINTGAQVSLQSGMNLTINVGP